MITLIVQLHVTPLQQVDHADLKVANRFVSHLLSYDVCEGGTLRVVVGEVLIVLGLLCHGQGGILVTCNLYRARQESVKGIISVLQRRDGYPVSRCLFLVRGELFLYLIPRVPNGGFLLLRDDVIIGHPGQPEHGIVE